MNFAGFQSVSLLDYPEHVCSIVFTQGCPFRCVYCHNPELVPVGTPVGGGLSEEEVLRRLESRKTMIDGVCVTGGEPTIHPGLPVFLRDVKQMGLKVKLDTNGVHPAMVRRVIQEGLVDFIAMDVKHTWDRYRDIVGMISEKALENCQETMVLIASSGLPFEFRTTVYPALHDEASLLQIAAMLPPGARYALQPVRYEKTLKADLPPAPALDVVGIAQTIMRIHPTVRACVRA